jgi:hypothetical protein
MKTRRNAEDKVRKAERKYRAEPNDKNYAKYAKEAARAGEPLVRFNVVLGGSAREPRDSDGGACWLQINVSGRALPQDSGIEADEWVNTTLSQFRRSEEGLARMIADSMNAFEPALLERWAARDDVNPRLRISAGDRMNRIERDTKASAVFRDVFESAGFSWWHTGGGCTAWGLNARPGDNDSPYAMITGGDATIPESDDEVIILGFYGEDGDYIEDQDFPITRAGAEAAVAAARRWLDQVN